MFVFLVELGQVVVRGLLKGIDVTEKPGGVATVVDQDRKVRAAFVEPQVLVGVPGVIESVDSTLLQAAA